MNIRRNAKKGLYWMVKNMEGCSKAWQCEHCGSCYYTAHDAKECCDDAEGHSPVWWDEKKGVCYSRDNQSIAPLSDGER